MGSCLFLSTLASVFFCGNLRCLRLHGRVETSSTQLGWETTRFTLVALTSGHSLQSGCPQGHILRHVLALRTSMLQIFPVVLLSSCLLGEGGTGMSLETLTQMPLCLVVPLYPPYPLAFRTRTFRAWQSETCQGTNFWFPQLPRNIGGLYCSHSPQGLGE